MVATRAEWRVETDNNDGDISVGVARSVESSKGVETGGDLAIGARGTDADERDPNIRGIMLASAASSFATLSNSAFSCSKREVLSCPITAPVVCRKAAFSASSSTTLLWRSENSLFLLSRDS